MDLLRREAIGQSPNTRIGKFFEAADKLSKKFLTSSSFMALIATFVQRITESTIDDQNIVLINWSKMEHVAIKGADEEIIEQEQCRSDLGSKEPHHSSSSSCRLKHYDAKHEHTHGIQNSHPSKSSKRGITRKESWIRNKSNYQRVCNTTVTVDHEFLGQKMTHRANVRE